MMGTPLTKLATRVTAATFWYISLPSSAKQREIKKFYVLSRKWVHDDNFFFLFSYFDVVDSNLVPGQSPCEQSLRLSFSLLRRRKGGCAWSASALWSRRSPNFWTSQSCFVCFFQCKQPFSGKTDGYFSSPLHNETSSWRRDLLEAKHQLFSTRFFLILFFLAGLSWLVNWVIGTSSSVQVYHTTKATEIFFILSPFSYS